MTARIASQVSHALKHRLEIRARRKWLSLSKLIREALYEWDAQQEQWDKEDFHGTAATGIVAEGQDAQRLGAKPEEPDGEAGSPKSLSPDHSPP